MLMETYSVEEVERVVLALYSGQDVAAANEWLTRFVAAPATKSPQKPLKHPAIKAMPRRYRCHERRV